MGLGYDALSNVYRAQGDTAKAIATLEQGIAAANRNLGLKLKLALAFEQEKRRDEAKTLYEQVLEGNPNQGIARNNLASMLSDSADGGDLERALELAKPLAESRVPDFRDTLGWVYYRLGQYDSAAGLLEGVVEDQPERGVFQYHLGMTYLKQGDTEKARTVLAKAVELGEKQAFSGLDEAKSVLQTL